MNLRGVLLGCLVISGCAQPVSITLVPPKVARGEADVLWRESFETLDPQWWREVILQGHTQYEATSLETRRCVKAESHASASILLAPIRFDPQTYAWLSWEWRVDQLVSGEALDQKGGSDAAARVYVYFETKGFSWQKRSLDYVWSASLPVGTILTSPYASKAKMIVVESGTAHVGSWQRVARNLNDDYRRCFRSRPPKVVAIGLMSDSDNTRSESLAYFDELEVGRRQR